MMTRDDDMASADLAFHRFGFGARPGLGLEGDARRALLEELQTPVRQPRTLLADSAERVLARRTYVRTVRRLARTRFADAENPMQAARAAASQEVGSPREAQLREVGFRFQSAIESPTGFRERWVLFWANWFTMAAEGAVESALTGPFEREAIRPNVTGGFEDLLMAAALHPGMLIYLDNVYSIGPNSPAGRRTGRGLNENLAREILELHTVGADGGYTQSDVVAFAKALTGWRLDRQTGERIFDERWHEPGPVTVMGERFGESGENQAKAILTFLARQPQTRQRIAERLTAHFLADTPPPGVVEAVRGVLDRTGGDLLAAAQALLNAPEAWQPTLMKARQPYDFVMATLRLTGLRPQMQLVYSSLAELGQRVFAAPSPEGWPDTQQDWIAADAISRRLDWANLVASRLARPAEIASRAMDALGDVLGPDTRLAVERAGDGAQAMTLLLMSPEMQRR
jgi:uncharacterized protein (DUF1800 family)